MPSLDKKPMIEAFLVPIVLLSQVERQEMFYLFNTHFEEVNRQQFEADLSNKQWTVLLKQEGILKGFSTLRFYEAVLKDEPVTIVYSGDTITDPSIWSSPVLAKAWIAAIQEIHGHRQERLFWLLISSGYRSYRFLTTFAKEFYPRYDRQTPTEVAAFMQHIATQQFGEFYHPTEGIVRFANPQILRSQLCTIAVEKLQDPDIAFFVQKNPGHINGDELVCLTEFTQANLTSAGLRMWKSSYPLHISSKMVSSVEPVLV
ncbi:MAG: hypothetical protein KME52_21755 [Desmonostoc geniculatum HA4340-LM1]|jgi:hypothetical protein|nr:hypothetical protein [Desmonostoc geniculatum HA4340-LM1]